MGPPAGPGQSPGGGPGGEAGLFDKMLALSNKKSTFVLVSGFFGCCIFTILFKYYLKSRF